MGTYTNGNIFRSSKEPIDQDAHEGRVQAILDIEVGELGISHTLRYDNCTDSNAWTLGQYLQAHYDEQN